MADSTFRERLALFRSRGGKSAAAHWFLRQLARLDLYTFYAIKLCPPSAAKDGARTVELVVLRDVSDFACYGGALVEALDAHSGCGIAKTVDRGGRIYAIVRGREVLSQLTIDLGGVDIDTPADLHINVGQGNAFLSYLYTAEVSRGRGFAKLLVEMTCSAIAAEGVRHCVCHVQATNLRSRNTFEGLGWQATGWLFTSAGGRPLGVVKNRLANFEGLVIRADPCRTTRSSVL